MSPGARSKFGAPCWDLSSFGSKFTLLKKVLVILLGLSGAPAVIRHHPQRFGDREIVPHFPSLVAPLPVTQRLVYGNVKEK